MVVVKIFKFIRNNPKKSLVFAGIAAYATKYVRRKIEENSIREVYCQEAKKYGDKLNRLGSRPRRITVFLNPVASDRGGKDSFEKNAVPLLHLSGLEVNIIKTEHEGQGKQYMGVIDTGDTDAVVIAGGDGSVSEVITGLMRRDDKGFVKKVPVGIIPVGKTNSLAKALFTDYTDNVKWLCETAMAIIKETTKPIDVMCIKGEDDKTVYAVSGMEWGPYKPAQIRTKKYWYFGPLKRWWTYFMQPFHDWSNVKAKLTYQLPCEGCSRCYVAPPKVQWRWWHMILPPRQPPAPDKDYSSIVNENCGVEHETDVDTVDFGFLSSNHQDTQDEKSITVSVGPDNLTRTEFIKHGWQRLGKERWDQLKENPNNLHVGKLHVQPQVQEGQEYMYYIDNEEFEVMPITVTLVKDSINVFFPEQPTHVAS